MAPGCLQVRAVRVAGLTRAATTDNLCGWAEVEAPLVEAAEVPECRRAARAQRPGLVAGRRGGVLETVERVGDDRPDDPAAAQCGRDPDRGSHRARRDTGGPQGA